MSVIKLPCQYECACIGMCTDMHVLVCAGLYILTETY